VSCSRLLSSFLCALAALLVVGAASAAAATRSISPSGSDSGNCSSSPCNSFAYAYGQAGSGDVIVVQPGVYPKQSVPAGSKTVTFRGASGNKVRGIDNEASNITYEGLDVDLDFQKAAGFYNGDASYVTFRNGRIGNVTDEKGVLLGGWSSTDSQHIVFDHVTFHNVHQVDEAVHNECIYSQSPGLTVRNSLFTDCATMDLMVTRGSWWDQPTYGGITLENNVFGHSVNGAAPRWHYYGFLLHGNMGQFTNARVVNNTFETNVGGMSNEEVGSASGVWANNIGGGWDCLSGMTYAGNVGKKCVGSDTAVSPDGSCGPPACPNVTIMPVGFADPLNDDFSLKAGSRAIDAGVAAYATARDRDGKLRDAKPDAGAYEYGAGGSEGAPGKAAAWRMRWASLKPKVVCRKARKRCPSSTKLRMRIGRAARVSVRLVKVRKGRDRIARIRKLPKVKVHKATRLSAHGLRAGKYRVRVRAGDASGAWSRPLYLKLRVR
jgi:hypothetical protein